MQTERLNFNKQCLRLYSAACYVVCVNVDLIRKRKRIESAMGPNTMYQTIPSIYSECITYIELWSYISPRSLRQQQMMVYRLNISRV